METEQSSNSRAEHTQESRGAWTLSDRLCTWFFFACSGLLILASPGLLDPVALRGADGLGMGMFAAFVVVASGLALFIALLLSIWAIHLPTGFRVLSLLPGLAGIIVGSWVAVSLRLQGK